MAQPTDPDQPRAVTSRSPWGAERRLLRKAGAVASLVVLTGVLLAPRALQPPSSHALARGGLPGRPVAALTPPAGTTWIIGVVTDQAAHTQDNVNVEAWPNDPAATAPVASALTYGGLNYNQLQAHGFFRLQVPSNQAYRIVFSAVEGKEDGDPFRIHWYGHDLPIMARTAGLATGRIRNLGTIALARQGKVDSETKAVARRAKIAAGTRGKVKVTVSSRYVTNVTGRIVVKVAGQQATHRLAASDHGKVTMKLPKLNRPGKYRVVAHFAGSNTVHSSKSKPVTITVTKRRTR